MRKQLANCLRPESIAIVLREPSARHLAPQLVSFAFRFASHYDMLALPAVRVTSHCTLARATGLAQV